MVAPAWVDLRYEAAVPTLGTLLTHTPLSDALLIVGALSFFPALALGPLVKHLLMTPR